jgi:hypothetical protein
MYRMHRVFCATSWDLEGERQAFYEALGKFNESAAMDRGVLYIPVSLVNVRDKRPYQYVVDENIRDCRHYIAALSDNWGPVERNFRKDYRLALTCARDPALPMQGVALLLRVEPEDPPPAFAAELQGAGISPVVFSDVSSFTALVNQLLAGWLEGDAPESAAGA